MLAQTIYGNWNPPQLSAHGGDIDRIISVIHVFMLLIFIPWCAFFLYCLFKFRWKTRNTALYHPIRAKVSKYGEIGVAIFEVILLLVFSMPVWAAYKNEPPAVDKRLEIRVIGEQFQWDFHYPGKDGKFGRTDPRLITASNVIGLVEDDPAAADDVVRIGEMHIPVGVPIYLRLSSKDVIHSFDIPTMRVKQDVIPGMEIPIWFQVNEDGLTERLREQMSREYAVNDLKWDKFRHHVASIDHAVKPGGEVILAKGADLGMTYKTGEETIARLRKSGLTSVKLEPRNPLEIVCSQLCGNSHFKMKAQLMTHTPAQYTAWLEEASKKVEFTEEF